MFLGRNIAVYCLSDGSIIIHLLVISTDMVVEIKVPEQFTDIFCVGNELNVPNMEPRRTVNQLN